MYIILIKKIEKNVGKKLIIFHKGWVGGGDLFAENSAKIISLIFEPFPNSGHRTELEKRNNNTTAFNSRCYQGMETDVADS